MKKNKIVCIALTLLAAGLVSCSDEWNNHYDQSSQVPETSLYEMVKADPSLSTFAQMVEVAGYDELLASSQTFTVFAPSNEALADIDLEDVDAVKRIVLNHISRFNCTSAAADPSVKMYNGKRFNFEGATFGGAELDKVDILAANGVLHTLKEQIPYAYNLREYIDTHDNTTKASEFIARFDENIMDIEASRPIGVDANGATVYDSVMIAYNPIFNHEIYGLGDIASEDSTFTMIIPTDVAWQAAYDRISPFFNVYNADPAIADSIKEVQTSLAILSDLIYRQKIDDPAAVPAGLISTSGSEIADPAALFAGTQPLDASNGNIYLANDNINYDNVETWNKLIEVEAEEQDGRTLGAGTTVYTRTVNADPNDALANQISELQYIEAVGNTTSRQPGVTFAIPNVLSGEYDIYAAFVPATIADPLANEQTRLQFTLSYIDAAGKKKTKAYKNNDFITSANEITLIKITDEPFQFPVSDFIDRLWLSDETNISAERVAITTLFVQTNVSNAEFNRNELVRRFRIDQILFVPVKK